MKKLCFSLVLLLTAITLFGSEVRVKVQPNPVEIDPGSGTNYGRGWLVISSDTEIETPESFPKIKNLIWHHGTSRQSSMTKIVNGKISRNFTISTEFIVKEEGKYDIPAFTVLCDGNKVNTPPVSFSAVLREPEKIKRTPPSDTAPVFAKLFLKDDTAKLYAGEEVPVIFSVYSPENISDAAIWQSMVPTYSSGDGVKTVFHDYTEGNPRTINVEKAEKRRAKVNGKEYAVWQFQTRFRPLSAGTLTLSAQCDAQFNAGGFSLFFDDVRTVPLTAVMPDITVLPLPSLPDGMPPFCGLIGDWDVQITGAEKDSIKAGDPLTLKLRIKGTGAADAFHAPDWQPDGFRVYPPELSKQDENTLLVSYTVIPVREGKTELDFGVSAFDAKAGKYTPFSWKKKILVQKADAIVKTRQITVDAGPTAESTKQNIPEGYITPDVPFAKNDIQTGSVRLPLYKNAVSVSGWLIAIGFLFLVFCLAKYVHDLTRDSTPEGARKHLARKRKKDLLKKLNDAKPSELGQYAGQISEYVNDILALPPGTGLAEAADSSMEGGATVSLAKALKVLSEEAWMPGASAKNMTETMKDDLIRGIKKFLILTLLLIPVSGIFADDEALAAYDKGDFQKALELYKEELKQDCRRISPALLYDMGNCYDQTGNSAKAYVLYERAMRLAPRDSTIRERCNIVRRKLHLPVSSELNHPKDVLPHIRDLMRPDEWLNICAIGIFLCLTGAGICLLRKKKAGAYVLAAGCAVAVIGFVLFLWQSAQTYSHDDAVVICSSLPVRSLPSEQSGKVEFTLKEGQLVRIEEIRSGWARISSPSGQGWIGYSSGQVLPLWNEDMQDLL